MRPLEHMFESRATTQPARRRGGEDGRMSDATVIPNEQAHHYDLTLDGKVIGHINYRDDGDRRVILHTKVDDDQTGQGYGTKLIVAALDDIRAKGKRAVTLCPMATAYVTKHDGYRDIVDPPHVLDS
ncbi:N-acetyltransferase [Salinibacterium sp. dk2585]|nr:N-acetyltransferase [Salinibacterium sp. dk2585]TXK52494.1 N-acetyltransferase [Salinibacterium sp. dk5596]